MGALIGYVTMLVGVLSVALPISVLSSTFSSKYASLVGDEETASVRPHFSLWHHDWAYGVCLPCGCFSAVTCAAAVYVYLFLE